MQHTMYRVIEWINRHWTHSRDVEGDFGFRAFIHIFVGLAIAFLSLAHWSLPLAMAYLFYKYERNEDAHTVDQAWKDLYGGLVGLVLGGVMLIFLPL